MRALLSSLPRWPTALSALCLLALAPVVAAKDRWGPNEPASSFGYRHDELFSLITILTGVSFLIMLLLLTIPVFRDRAKPGKKAHYDHGRSLHDKRFTTIVSLVVFVVLDAWVLIVAMSDLRDAHWNFPGETDEGAYRVEVLAQQWAWNFRSPGVDGEFGTADDIVTINELVVPMGLPEDDADGNRDLEGHRPVVLNVTSKDVIHSFFVPDMRIKRDANPGSMNRLWFEAIKPGKYQILCAELCGYAHYQMYGTLLVLAPDDFDTWHEEASRQAVAAYDENDTEAHWAWDWKE